MARPKNYQRQDVIEKALDVFWKKGYAATSLSDLVVATGLNKRSIYNEFGSKENLFLEVIDEYSKLRAPVIEVLTRQPQGISNVKLLLQGMAQGIDERGCLIVLSLNERELLNETALLKVIDNSANINSLIAKNIKAEFPSLEAEKISALIDLISSQTFSIVGMAKAGKDSKSIQAATDLFITLLDKSVENPKE